MLEMAVQEREQVAGRAVVEHHVGVAAAAVHVQRPAGRLGDRHHALQQPVAHRLRIDARLREAAVAPAQERRLRVGRGRLPDVEPGAVREHRLERHGVGCRGLLAGGGQRILELVVARRRLAQLRDHRLDAGTPGAPARAPRCGSSRSRPAAAGIPRRTTSPASPQCLPQAVQVAGRIGRVGGVPGGRHGGPVVVAAEVGGEPAAHGRGERRRIGELAEERLADARHEPGRDEAHPHHRDAVEEAVGVGDASTAAFDQGCMWASTTGTPARERLGTARV